MISEEALTKITLRDYKTYISKIMANYSDELPVIVTIEHKDEVNKFEIVPKSLMKIRRTIDSTIHTITTPELETINIPGYYISCSHFKMGDSDIITNYYGLFVDHDGVRDLRYFETELKCISWLKKKIKSL